MRLIHKIILPALLVSALAGCANNYTNVRTFAQATTSITQATPVLLADNKLSCVRSQQLAEEVLTVLKNPDATQYAEEYRTICDERENKLQPIVELNVVLNNFSTAVESLARDDFVTGKPEADAASNFLSNMGKLGAFELSSGQVSAVTGLVQFVTNAMLNSERQGVLGKAFSAENQQNLQSVIAALGKAGDFYINDLRSEKILIGLVSNEIEHKLSASESLAVSEFKLRLRGQRDLVEARMNAVRQYQQALVKLKDAIAPAAQSINQPDNREILREIKDFARQAYDVNRQFRAAFGN